MYGIQYRYARKQNYFFNLNFWCQSCHSEMGNTNSRNMDKRTSRRQYRDTFAKGIADQREQIAAVQAFDDDYTGLNWDSSNIRVCIRKRPIFPRELENSEFDVITCKHRNVIVVSLLMYVCCMPIISPISYAF